MKRTLKQLQQNQLIHNVYCPTVEQTIETCKSEIMMLHGQQKVYFEVPFEQFNDVYHHFHKNDAIKKGAFTYIQVFHIAETGNIYQLKISEEGRIYFADESISMSTAISFAQSKWNNATREEAVENAVLTGLTIIGEAFAEDVIAMQIKHANVAEHINLSKGIKDAVRKNGAKAVIKKMATKATKKVMSSFVTTKKASMLMNTNEVTGAFVTGAMSSVDIVNMIKEEMSPGKLFENISKTVASVADNRIVGSLLATKMAKKILDFVIKEDVIEMLEVFNTELAVATEIFLLNEQELKQALNDFNVVYDLDDELRKMYTADDRVAYVKALIENELSCIVKLRMYLQIPTNEELYKVIERIQ
ncbi:MAG: hypothetical protein ACI33M_06320 [Lysinibacillus sp.]